MSQPELFIYNDNPEYDAFVEKFKAKKTTDDCYTPQNIYDVVARWVVNEYGVDPAGFVRPFWPGGDYQNTEYPDGCTVVDNPPFSIRAQILDWYMDQLQQERYVLRVYQQRDAGRSEDSPVPETRPALQVPALAVREGRVPDTGHPRGLRFFEDSLRRIWDGFRWLRNRRGVFPNAGETLPGLFRPASV